jgi:hypothetical protein
MSIDSAILPRTARVVHYARFGVSGYREPCGRKIPAPCAWWLWGSPVHSLMTVGVIRQGLVVRDSDLQGHCVAVDYAPAVSEGKDREPVVCRGGI